MKIKVAINGFGRIGRLAFRKIFDDSMFEVCAINDLTDSKTLSHLLKYDSAQGSYKLGSIFYDENNIIVDDKKIRVFSEKEPLNLPWKELGIDLVFECTGFFTSKEKCEMHITAGAKKVILSAPGTDIKMVVYGVNEDVITSEDDIISAASCTTNCLAPMVKVLNDSFKIKCGLMTTIHAYTNDQNTLDAPHRKDLRRARAAAANIVPNTTGAAKAIGLVIPELQGKLNGAAQRVPVISGSLTELTCILENKTTVEEINEVMKKAQSESFGYNEDDIVSTDLIGREEGSLYDSTQTILIENDVQLVKTVAWYDNEMGYTCQMIRVAKYLFKEIC